MGIFDTAKSKGLQSLVSPQSMILPRAELRTPLGGMSKPRLL